MLKKRGIITFILLMVFVLNFSVPVMELSAAELSVVEKYNNVVSNFQPKEGRDVKESEKTKKYTDVLRTKRTSAKSLVDEREPNNDYKTAQSLTLTQYGTGMSDAIVSGRINYDYDLDYYKFTVTKQGILSVFLFPGDMEDLAFDVEDAQGNLIASVDDEYGGEFELATDLFLEPGTYYVSLLEINDGAATSEDYGLMLDFVEAGSQPVFEGPFVDVSWDFWASYEIDFLSFFGVINGYEDGSFKPNNKVTRAQAVVMIIKAMDVPIQKGTPSFNDVSSGYWAKDYINTAVKLGIISGYSDGTFKPGNDVTRAQMAVMLSKAFKLNSTSKVTFNDVSSSHWASAYINRVATAGVAGGSNGNFRPNEATTRAHMAVFLARAMEPGFRVNVVK